MRTLVARTAEISKRQLLLGIGAAANVLIFDRTKSLWPKTNPDVERFGDVAKVFGPDHLESEANLILDQFAQAKSGRLMAQYQASWPFSFVRNQKGLQAIEEVCNRDAKYINSVPHRVRALPAVANLHALVHLETREAAEYTQNVLTRVHNDALNLRPNTTVLEIFWTNALTSLMKNPITWLTFRLGMDLVKQGMEICKGFFTIDSRLLFPAMDFYQFLLTYISAAEARNDFDLLSQLTNIRSDIAEFSNMVDFIWFAQLDRLYSSRNTWSTSPPPI